MTLNSPSYTAHILSTVGTEWSGMVVTIPCNTEAEAEVVANHLCDKLGNAYVDSVY